MDSQLSFGCLPGLLIHNQGFLAFLMFIFTSSSCDCGFLLCYLSLCKGKLLEEGWLLIFHYFYLEISIQCTFIGFTASFGSRTEDNWVYTLSITAREGLGRGKVWSQQGCVGCSACALRDLCALPLHTGVPSQSPDLSPGYVRGIAELWRAAHKHWEQLRWGTSGGTICASNGNLGGCWRKAFPNKSSPEAQGSQSWYIHYPGCGPTIPWPWLLILRLVLRVDRGSEESLLSVLGEGKGGQNDFWHSAQWFVSVQPASCPVSTRQAAQRVSVPTLVCHHSSLTSALPPCSHDGWVSDPRLPL